jgi:hypothetical protein
MPSLWRGLDYELPGRLLEDFALLVTLKRFAIFSSSSTNSPLKTKAVYVCIAQKGELIEVNFGDKNLKNCDSSLV